MTTRGVVLVGAEVPSIPEAVVRVQALDVTEQDADAVVLAETELTLTHERGTETRVAFELGWDTPDDTRDYSLAAHVDLTGEGDVTRGDLVTTAWHPVPTARPEPLVLPVEVVG